MTVEPVELAQPAPPLVEIEHPDLHRVELAQPDPPRVTQPAYKFAAYAEPLQTLLSYPFDPSPLESIFVSQMAFFYVRGNFNCLHRRIDQIHDVLRKDGFVPLKLPSKPDLSTLCGGGALSLPSILRLHLALEHLRQKRPTLYQEICGVDSPLILRGSVIPSICYVDPVDLGKAREAQEKKGFTEADLVRKMNTYAEKLVRADGVSLRVFPRGIFSDRLQVGEKLSGKRDARIGHFRITRVTSLILVHALTDEADLTSLKALAPSWFREDHTLGPGKGKYTIPLLPNNGNQIFHV